LRQFPVRGGDYPDIYVVCPGSSKTLELLLLENA
jgi:hypothetical protein